MLDLAGEGIFGLDSRGRFIFVNPTASKLLGYSSEELIGLYINKTIGKHLYKKTAQQRERLMLVSKEEQTFLSKKGLEFPIDYVSTPIFNSKELLEGSVVVFSDITKRKKHEDELKKATLEAQNANLSKSVFLTNMSHELRTPLNAILGFATLLKKSTTLNEVEKQNLQTIRNSGEHLLSIINEILEFAKIEAGKISINPTSSNLHNLLREIESMFTERCMDKNLDFTFNIEEAVPKYVKCDEKRVRQIFINILGNALKFTNSGKIEVKIKHAKNRLKIKIKDTGIGMTKKAKELIFKPFEQVGESNYKQKGTGLGLAITKELIEKMNGKISFSSKENVGTIFNFEIEIQIVNAFEDISTEEKHENILVSQKSYDYKVLVADDIKINRDLLVQLLDTYNLKTYEAKDGLEVLECCKTDDFDLIFMDILMPNLNGLETIKELKKNDKYKAAPIVAISANVFEDDKQKALESGADDFLTKPFKEKDIINTLEEYLDMSFTYFDEEEPEDIFYEMSEQTIKEIVNAAASLNTNLILEILKKENIQASIKRKIEKLLLEYKFDEVINLISNNK